MENYLKYIFDSTTFILEGSVLTVKLYFVTIVFSIPLGIILALMKISRYKFLKLSIGFYTWVFRGTPLLLQLFFTYYGLATIGINLPPFTAAALTFVINYSAYLTEIYRAGIESIDKGQYEASKALNMNYYQTMKRIILPQVVRRTIPPTCNEAISLVKDTALVVVIGMGDLLRSANSLFARDFAVTPFVIAAVIYLLMTSVIVFFFKKVEVKYSIYE
ncbi:MAG: amino acid ABC transporter permease [Leptospirales bacterium]|nr:amino acid ABC transporter permease [Leptospirales bacterium]